MQPAVVLVACFADDVPHDGVVVESITERVHCLGRPLRRNSDQFSLDHSLATSHHVGFRTMSAIPMSGAKSAMAPHASHWRVTA